MKEHWKEIVTTLSAEEESSLVAVLRSVGLDVAATPPLDLAFPDGLRSPTSDAIRDWMTSAPSAFVVRDSVRAVADDLLGKIPPSAVILPWRFSAFRDAGRNATRIRVELFWRSDS